jgi:hypothetical protein
VTVTILDLAVILIGILSVLTAVAVVALIRQVGVLHLRIQPVAGVTGAGGPDYGADLRMPAELAELAGRAAKRFLVGFVSPGCQVCGPVTSAFGRVARTSGAGTAVLLVVDSGQAAADEYIRGKGVGFLPYIADAAAFADNVPGAPWAVVTDESGKVIVSGGVNTLDNIEEMLAQADELAAHPPQQAAPAVLQVSQRVEAGEHVI